MADGGHENSHPGSVDMKSLRNKYLVAVHLPAAVVNSWAYKHCLQSAQFADLGNITGYNKRQDSCPRLVLQQTQIQFKPPCCSFSPYYWLRHGQFWNLAAITLRSLVHDRKVTMVIYCLW